LVASTKATPNKQQATAEHPQNEPSEDNRAEEGFDVTSLEEALAEAAQQSSNASPVSSDSEHEPQTSEDDTPTRTRRNTIMTSKQKEGETSKKEEGTGLSTGTRKPKIREPSTFDGDRDNLRGWLAQLAVYFEILGWEEDHNDDKIKYTTCLLRGDAMKWYTPYAEKAQAKSWTTWEEYQNELRRQFGPVNARDEARAKIRKLKQGQSSMTDYWNDFRLIASTALMDGATMSEFLIAGMKKELQQAWILAELDQEDVEAIALWAIKKEARMETLKYNKNSGEESTKTDRTVRNQNGTFKSNTTYEPMDLDATNRVPRLNIPLNEYQKRMKQGLCLRCGKSGHRIQNCNEGKKGITQQPRWSPRRNNATAGGIKNWRQDPRIKTIDMDEEKTTDQPAGNDDCPQ